MVNLTREIDNFIEGIWFQIRRADTEQEAIEILQAVIEDAQKLIERIQNEAR